MSASKRRTGSVAVLTLALAMAGSLPSTATPGQPNTPPGQGTEVGKDSPTADKMSSHSQELLLQAEQAGKSRVTVMALTDKGQTAAVTAKLKDLGATVGYVHDKLGYVRASIPTKHAWSVAQIAQVRTVDLDEMVKIPAPEADGPITGSDKWTGPDENTPLVNPYMPIADTGVAALRQAHPEFDGRGVTIGVLDSGVDLDHPALQTTSTGERKVTDWVTVTDPLLEADATWRLMLTHVSGPTATFSKKEWKLPQRDGADYAISVFSETAAKLSDDVEGDIDRDGKKDGSWGVLYDYETHDIWVDVNGNQDFTDDEVMRPYREKHQVNHFGTDDPATSVMERMPFVVEYREGVDLTPAGMPGRTVDAVNIGLVASAHGTHVAGIAAGNMPGWKMGGAAPGAKIVSAKACVYSGGCTNVALTEGMIELVANKHVDVVNMSIGGLPALNDGNTTRTALYNRLIDEYGVQIFVSAGNSGPGTNTIGDPSVASDVISVAAGASKDTWLSNYGAQATAPYWVQNYSSHGPREDGGFKPNLMAPGSAISSVPMFMGPEDLAQVSYKLPVGLSMFNGTSMASPQAAGATTALLSAARQRDVAVTPAQLRESLFTTARFISGLPASAQGNGQIRVDRAWPVLAKAGAVENRYEISAPVCTPLADMLPEPGRGTGVYNRCGAREGGQKVGESRTYDVKITRTEGPAEQTAHTIRWIGNDGTWSSASTVDLPLGETVTVPVTARPTKLGEHSAILDITPVGARLGTRMMADVVVATDLGSAPYTATRSGSVERVRAESMYVTVPQGAKTLQVNMTGIANGSVVRFLALNPYGVPVESSKVAGQCYTQLGNPKICKPTSRAYQNPMPGVWEITVDASRRTPTTKNPYRITASAQGISVTPEEQTIPSVKLGEPTPVPWTIRNDFGPVTIAGQGGALGSARTLRPTVKQGETHTYTVEVPAGMERLDASIGATSDPGADLDLTVKNAAGTVVASSADGDSEEAVSIATPAPGTYTIEVDGYAVEQAGGTAYDYLDVIFGQGLGDISIESRKVTLGHGQTMGVVGRVVAKAPVPEGRRLMGEMNAVNTEGSVIGTARVYIDKVVE